jgi:hypothetical protein
MRTSPAERFSASFAAVGDCLIWSKALRRDGYGNFFVSGRCWLAHRYAWTLLYGDIPAGMQLNHRCHNRACVNPVHLYLGTQAENMADMKEAGRSVGKKGRGEGNHQAKLTEETVRAIRASTASHAALSRELGVSSTLVCAIRQRKVWRHVP